MKSDSLTAAEHRRVVSEPATDEWRNGSSFLDPVATVIGRITLRLPNFFPTRAQRRALAESFDLDAADRFAVDVARGPRIAALRLPAATDQPHRLPIVYAHGYLESKECHLRLATVLTAIGHDVILYDQRGHGDSTGHGMAFGAHECHDLHAVIDDVQRRGWMADRVITMGHSNGAATALIEAPDDPRVAGIVAMAPFYSAEQAIRAWTRIYSYRMMRVEMVLRGMERAARRQGFGLADARCDEAVRRIAAPVLFLVGENDVHLTKNEHARRLASLMPPERAELHEIKGADHFDLARRAWPRLDETVAAFCRRIDEQVADTSP